MPFAHPNVGDVTRTVRRIGAVMSLLIGLMLVALIGGLVVVDRMNVLSEAMRTIQLDNLTWRAAQLSLEHKALLIAIQQELIAQADNDLDGPNDDWRDIILSFDVYYSRLSDFEDLIRRIENLHGHPLNIRDTVEVLIIGRNEMALLLDDPDARGADDLGQLYIDVQQAVPFIRQAVITTLHEINELLTVDHVAGASLSTLAQNSELALIIVFMTTMVLAGVAARRFSLTAARLDEARSRLFTVVGSSPEAILSYDLSGRMMAYNDAARELTGYDRTEFPAASDWGTVISKRLLRQFVPDGADHDPEKLLRASVGKWLRTVIRHKSGTVLQIELTVAINDQQAEPIAVIFAHAVSDRLREARRIRREQGEAILLAQTRDRFLSEMSHELRTPLHGVIASLDLTGTYPLPSEVKRLTDVARNSARAAIEQIDDVLDEARKRHGRRSGSETFVPSAAAANIVDDMKVLASMRSNQITLELSPGSQLTGSGSARLFHRALNNLVSNACKFTRHGEIAVRLLDAAPGVLRVEVEDSGPGIDASALPHIFSDYVSGDAEGWDGNGGFGLGLPIFASSVGNMGGRYGVHSTLGEGTLFWFEFPFDGEIVKPTEPLNGPRLPTFQSLRPGPLDVLVVDDSAVNCELLSQMLTLLGHRPVTSLDGFAAVEVAARHRFDLVLTDLRMNGLDGYQTAEAIRAAGASKDAVILGVTAHLGQTPVEKALAAAARMDHILVKPVTTADIRRAIELRVLAHGEEGGPDIWVVDKETAGYARSSQGQERFDSLVGTTLEAVMAIVREIEALEPCAASPALADRVHYQIGECAVLGLSAVMNSLRSAEDTLRLPGYGDRADVVSTIVSNVDATQLAFSRGID